ncbi:unnamed protein product [Bursaphelenchus xylophilus]|uniref:(pine wood nematode) hypothetical protein n=1 Tax=Bursaphelenchus xylophilus TaxID=6326 RepID=A0A1I7SR92_BURXY|nr:unnamed protein product [Bursaphelenchus xylophilus]CAG9111002.1 unnamed protein product [Bursaphelenchus xylophilus]
MSECVSTLTLRGYDSGGWGEDGKIASNRLWKACLAARLDERRSGVLDVVQRSGGHPPSARDGRLAKETAGSKGISVLQTLIPTSDAPSEAAPHQPVHSFRGGVMTSQAPFAVCVVCVWGDLGKPDGSGTAAQSGLRKKSERERVGACVWWNVEYVFLGPKRE